MNCLRGRGRLLTSVFVLAGILVAAPVWAQDADLEPLFLILEDTDAATDASAQSLQVYRIPVGFTVRSLEEQGWGMRLLLPVSFGAHDLKASTGAGDLVERIETVTVVPGAELLFAAGENWMLKPYVELGLTGSSAESDPRVLYSVGLRARGERDIGTARLTAGFAARYSSSRSSRIRLDDYTSVEAGADLLWPAGFTVGTRQARFGGYAIARYFPDLDLPASYDLRLDHVYEVGVSFSADPGLALWKLKIPWIGLGYRFGDLFNGVRISFSFPF
jgi:hypothetical protein